jgi:hypothetical protein
MRFFKKLKMELSYDPAALLLGVYPRDIYTPCSLYHYPQLPGFGSKLNAHEWKKKT